MGDENTRYHAVTLETLENLRLCFADGGEFATFVQGLDELVSDLHFTFEARRREMPGDKLLLTMNQIAAFTIFIRQNMDLVRQLISKCETRPLSDDEVRAYKGL